MSKSGTVKLLIHHPLDTEINWKSPETYRGIVWFNYYLDLFLLNN